jgi:UDP-N-acetylglucosamine 4,6-dehydratase
MFVPKIPSIRITELAEAMAPGVPHDIVGIRPGEKLHETMLTADDARTTFQTPDRYIVEPPAFSFWHRSNDGTYDGSRVAAGFHYSSDGNSEWLSVEDIREWLEVTKGER